MVDINSLKLVFPIEKVIDIHYMEIQFSKDPSFLEEVLGLYQSVCKEEIKSLKKNIPLKNYESIYRSLHKLKGSTSNYTQQFLVDDLKRFEQEYKSCNSVSLNLEKLEHIDTSIQVLLSYLSEIVENWKKLPPKNNL
jgi:HPt (histidine-containing phosphotransfer) domain-containing protein